MLWHCHSRRSKDDRMRILYGKGKRKCCPCKGWAIVEELHGNIADGDKLKAYIKSPRYWKPQHFSSLIAFYIIGIPAPLAGNQQPWELNKAGSELTPALSFSLPSRRYFLSGRWGVKNYKDKFKVVWELPKRIISCMLLRVRFSSCLIHCLP